MNFSYFARKNPWVQFLQAADTGGSSGGGGKPQTVPELTQRITALEGEKQKLTDEVTAEKQKVTTLDGEKQKLTDEVTAEKQKVTTLEGEKQKLSDEVTAEKQKVTTLEGEKQNAIKERDQAKVDATKANEAMAKAGITAPGSDSTKREGEKQAGDDDKNLSPAQRLAKIFDAAGK